MPPIGVTRTLVLDIWNFGSHTGNVMGRELDEDDGWQRWLHRYLQYTESSYEFSFIVWLKHDSSQPWPFDSKMTSSYGGLKRPATNSLRPLYNINDNPWVLPCAGPSSSPVLADPS